MLRLLTAAAIALALLLPGTGPAAAQETDAPQSSAMSAAERETLRREIRAYLLENPEVILEAINILEERRAEAARQNDGELVAEHAEALFQDDHSWVGGNPEGDVTVVEFSDYRCVFCKRAHPILRELLAEDGDIRLVVKEFPILGPQSVVAGRMAIAAAALDPELYRELNGALMTHEGEMSEVVAYRIAGRVGYDVAELKARAASEETEEALRQNYELARALGLQGTPSFVIGEQVIRGFVEKDEMADAVAEARTGG